jgi:hypothetical protein
VIRAVTIGSALLLCGGCLIELEGDEGWLWCIEATGANGTRSASGGNVNILREGDWVSSCWGLCEPQHKIMTRGENGDYDEMHPVYPQWQSMRDALIASGIAHCEFRLMELEAGGAIDFDDPTDVTCATAVAAQDPLLWKRVDHLFKKGSCDDAGSETGSATAGSSDTGAATSSDTGTATSPDTGTATSPDTTSGGVVMGPEIYGLTSYNQVRSCTTNTSSKKITCNVDQEFVRYLADHETLLWDDDATMVAATVSTLHGWRFDTCGSTSLMYALGFRQHDVLVKVESTSVSDLDAAFDAYGQFASPLFDGGTVTGSFYRGSTLWTFTANRVNNPKYP